ncbi:hypothetical protein OE88DRAFT_462640 [Heliocybe sulcata]|uniref:Uncharacterized protein n=1 Tax=Heliocybe sulcata TaxID=5364 RepID=A0A5C3MW13_9AGAM|nr:hypothetical protein OE88DRAFT_462640 [Heliocybe sulcata]
MSINQTSRSSCFSPSAYFSGLAMCLPPEESVIRHDRDLGTLGLLLQESSTHTHIPSIVRSLFNFHVVRGVRLVCQHLVSPFHFTSLELLLLIFAIAAAPVAVCFVIRPDFLLFQPVGPLDPLDYSLFLLHVGVYVVLLNGSHLNTNF